MVPKPNVTPRDISPILQKVREFLLGRPHTTALRFEPFVATRSPPPPCIPDGPTHKLNTNYYFARDVRREVNPPTLISVAKPQIPGGEKGAEIAAGCKKLPTPGTVYKWD